MLMLIRNQQCLAEEGRMDSFCCDLLLSRNTNGSRQSGSGAAEAGALWDASGVCRLLCPAPGTAVAPQRCCGRPAAFQRCRLRAGAADMFSICHGDRKGCSSCSEDQRTRAHEQRPSQPGGFHKPTKDRDDHRSQVSSSTHAGCDPPAASVCSPSASQHPAPAR